MPRRKQSRMPTRGPRAAAAAKDEPVDMNGIDLEKATDKLKLLLEDFDHEVESRVNQMEDEINNIMDSIRQLYRSDLMRYPPSIRNKPWQQCEEDEDAKKSLAVRSSVVSIVNTAETVLQTATVKKRGRKPKMILDADGIEETPSVGRSTRSTRQRSVLGLSQATNMMPPPPTTARRQNTRKAMQSVAETPANQGIPNFASLYITPKFNPKTPLPPGTVKRHPRMGEIAISLSGSPLQISPPSLSPRTGVESLVSSLNVENIDEDTKTQLHALYEKVGKMLNV